MSAPAEPQDAVPGPPPLECRLKLIRVKRKRDAEAPDDLVVQGFEAPGKRPHTLDSAMEGLGLEQGKQDAHTATPKVDAEGTSTEPSQPARRMQRYRKLSTLSAAQLRTIDQTGLYTLLASGHQQQQEGQQRQRVGVKNTAALPGGNVERAVQQLQAGQTARYEHIRRRRGLSAFSITEQSNDPLLQLASVYDVVRHEPLPGPQGSEVDVPAQQRGAAAAAVQQQHQDSQPQRQERRLSKAQRASQQYEEGTLLCNYLPMIREYLQARGQHLPDSMGQGPAGSSQEGASSMEQDGSSGHEGECVYDLYAEVEDVQEGREGQEEGWWELHSSGRAPVVQILEDDSWVVLEQSDVEDSDADSEDSNAEGFYAHDYPDEASGSSSDDDGYDPEGDTFGRRQKHGWDADSYSSDEG